MEAHSIYIDIKFLEDLNTVSIFCRLALALLCGGIIGLDRGYKKRAAGFRTYMLVCVGATLVMTTNQYIYLNFGASDPARLGAQVISGIGFLGAGTIIVTRQHQVIGLTTAAGLWASACMGLAIGIGFYAGALMGSGFIFIIITAMNGLDRKVISNSRNMDIYIEFKEGGQLSDFFSFAHKHQILVTSVEFSRPKYESGLSMAALLTLKLPKRHPHLDVLERFQQIESVYFVEEV